MWNIWSKICLPLRRAWDHCSQQPLSRTPPPQLVLGFILHIVFHSVLCLYTVICLVIDFRFSDGNFSLFFYLWVLKKYQFRILRLCSTIVWDVQVRQCWWFIHVQCTMFNQYHRHHDIFNVKSISCQHRSHYLNSHILFTSLTSLASRCIHCCKYIVFTSFALRFVQC